MLVMIPGGPSDAGAFAGLAGALAVRNTVVSYDPHGNSRSTFDGTPEEQQLDIHGDDTARLVEALGGEPVYVLGSSGGAPIGLNLAARHPERVRALVAHEPPCILVLPAPSGSIAGTEEVYDTYRRDGIGPAMQKFMKLAGLGGASQPPDAQQKDAPPQSKPTPEDCEAFARIKGNMDYFLQHGLRPISFYVPEVDTLRGGPVRVVVRIGESSEGQLAHRAAVALAEKLGTQPVTFPGDHGGYGSHPVEFAETLHRVFRGH